MAKKREILKTILIYITDIWSGKVRKAKYKKYDANDNKRKCKVQNTKCKIQITKYKI